MQNPIFLSVQSPLIAPVTCVTRTTGANDEPAADAPDLKGARQSIDGTK
jgi:hypothetical protein